MRLITLQHAAGNHDFKIIGRHINTLGEKYGLFADGQYGSRNHKAANTQALNKSLLIDISRLQKKTLIMVANDAKSCYDRVVLWALYFVMRKFRISKEIAKTMVEVLNEMTHNISTAHGVSEKYYGGKDTFPNGMCQGNGAAAQAWAAISSILLTICHEQGYGADIISAINKEIGTIVGFAFVDDTDLADMARKGEDDEKLVNRMQKCLTLWNELIETTGGALEPDKTDWSIIAYEKHFGLWVPQPRKQFTLHLVDEHTREKKAIRLLEPQEARRTLGIWQAMDGNQEKQLETMVENIRTYGEQIQLSGLSRSEKAIALQSTITRTIAYAGMATTLNGKQTETINRELRKATIRGLGLDRTTPVVIIHGPKAKNGLGIMDYAAFQLTEHIKVLLDHMETDTITGKLIRNLIELHTLEIGMDGTIWEHKEERIYTMMTQSWVKNTVFEMHKHKIRLESQSSPTLKTWRIGDRFIMDMIMNSPGNRFTTMELKGIQEVRRFLKVSTLSDILVNGVVSENIWQARTAEDSTSKFQYEWMHSETPSQEEILIWQQALIRIGIQGPNIRIANTLGSWFKDSIIYDAWINEEEDKIYIRNEETHEVFAKQEGDRGRHQRMKFIKCNTSRNERYIQQHQRIRIMKEGEQVYFISKILSTVQRYRSQREVYWTETRSKGSVHEMNRFIQKLEKGTATLVTDASDDKSGNLACAFYEELPLEQEDEINNVQGYSQIPSTLEDTNSFRGELGGILQALRFVTRLEKEMKLSKGGCIIKCDSRTAIEVVAELLEKPYPSSKASNFDILRMLYNELQNTKLKIVFQWVRGHQDRNSQYEELDNDARANFRADRLAAETIRTMSGNSIHVPDSYEGPTLLIAGVKVYNDIYGKINEQVNGKPLTQYWINKGRFNGRDSEVDWQALAWAMNKFSFSDQIILMKLLSNRAPTATVMHRRQLYNDATCPLCSKTDENERHIYLCEDIEAQDFKQTQIEQIRSTLTRSGLLQGRLVRQIVVWLKHYLSRDHDRSAYRIEEIQRDDLYLGDDAIFQGIMHRECRTRCAGGLGVRLIIKTIIEFRLRVWKHRCQLVHNREENSKRRQKLEEEFVSMQSQRPSWMTPIDAKRFGLDLAQFNQLIIKDKESMIKAWKNMVEKYNRLKRKGLLRFWPQQPQTERQQAQRRQTMRTEEIQRLQDQMLTAGRSEDEELIRTGEDMLRRPADDQEVWIRRVKARRKRVRYLRQTALDHWRMSVTSKANREATENTNTEKRIYDRETGEEEGTTQGRQKRMKIQKIDKWLQRQHDPGE
jgi:hypothetical protein